MVAGRPALNGKGRPRTDQVMVSLTEGLAERLIEIAPALAAPGKRPNISRTLRGIMHAFFDAVPDDAEAIELLRKYE
jgi:hypothetical protein